ncbi:MAG: methyltransferase domain-containing protein [Clostridiales bacterium]|nr:methyltransferase domain-containing protein [Clostridiales bacterium]
MENNGSALICAENHLFDIAKEGYTNLLPSNKMHSKAPGDTKQMIASRRRFLESGYYDIFSSAINEQLIPLFSGNIKLLDVGCGEGYYTSRLKEAFEKNNIKVDVAGFDISKFAVKAASKKYNGIEFAVASAFEIPVKDSFCDCLINVFAPIVPDELRRVIKMGGYMLIAVPTENHLMGLKELVYDEPYKNEVKDTYYEGFDFVKRVSVKENIELNSAELISDLFSMTPYYWKTSVEGSQRVAQASHLSTEIGFDLLIYRAI